MEKKSKLKRLINYFSKIELAIWLGSIVLIITAFFIFDRSNYLNMIASLIGTTSLIFCAKGNPFGQVLIIVFSSLYAYISFTFRYYGEMLTYLVMTLPMAVFSLISWLKNTYNGNRAEVKVNKITNKELILAFPLTAIITLVFFFVLRYFNTPNLVVSTISIATSFSAAYLTFKRCEFFALCYALNDIVLIVLWTFATMTNIEYLSVVICFSVFFVNDIYTFLNWTRIKARQGANNN